MGGRLQYQGKGRSRRWKQALEANAPNRNAATALPAHEKAGSAKVAGNGE
jgi:hypothetical protein